jgi:hypothetical protein
MIGPLEKEAAELTPHAAPEIAAEIRKAVRDARGLPGEAAILRFPPTNRKSK